MLALLRLPRLVDVVVRSASLRVRRHTRQERVVGPGLAVGVGAPKADEGTEKM